LDRGVIGTSANIHGLKSPVTGEEVEEQLDGSVDLIIYGTCPGGLESTIIDITDGKLKTVRQGAIPVGKINQAYNRFLSADKL